MGTRGRVVVRWVCAVALVTVGVVVGYAQGEKSGRRAGADMAYANGVCDVLVLLRDNGYQLPEWAPEALLSCDSLQSKTDVAQPAQDDGRV